MMYKNVPLPMIGLLHVPPCLGLDGKDVLVTDYYLIKFRIHVELAPLSRKPGYGLGFYIAHLSRIQNLANSDGNTIITHTVCM